MAPDKDSMETRLTEIEEELRRIKQILAEKPVDNGTPWWKKLIGSHENDPVFAEIVELGRQFRAGQKAKKILKSTPSRKTATQE